MFKQLNYDLFIFYHEHYVLKSDQKPNGPTTTQARLSPSVMTPANKTFSILHSQAAITKSNGKAPGVSSLTSAAV